MPVLNQSPTELFYERHELPIQEASLAWRLKANRRKETAERRAGRRTNGFLRRPLASWGRTGVPFFRA